MIRAFLSFLETRGAGEVRAGELREALAADGAVGRAALVAEGVIRVGPLATTHPCEGLDCAREVRERTRAADGARRFLAVCTRSPRECETLHVEGAELAQEEIVLDAFVAAVRRALRIEAPHAATRGALAGADEPVLLGEEILDGTARDVFFARRPRAPALRVLLAERRAAARPAWVLVPTARGIDPELLARHAAGHVEIGALTDLLVVQRGKIAPAARLRVVPASGRFEPGAAAANAGENEAASKRRSLARDRFPRVKRWGEITFFAVEAEGSIGIEVDLRQRRFTAAELGLGTRSGKPVRAFDLLRRICDGNGVFDTKPWGGRENGKQVVSELRRGLCAAFEIAESPIEPYSRGTRSWKTKFRALAGTPAEVRAVERAVFGEGGERGRGVPERGEERGKKRKE